MVGEEEIKAVFVTDAEGVFIPNTVATAALVVVGVLVCVLEEDCVGELDVAKE